MITRRKPHSEKAVVCNMYKYEVAAPTIGACYFFYLCNLRIGNLPMSIHITYEHSMSSVRIIRHQTDNFSPDHLFFSREMFDVKAEPLFYSQNKHKQRKTNEFYICLC